jgi:hypothetical protein
MPCLPRGGWAIPATVLSNSADAPSRRALRLPILFLLHNTCASPQSTSSTNWKTSLQRFRSMRTHTVSRSFRHTPGQRVELRSSEIRNTLEFHVYGRSTRRLCTPSVRLPKSEWRVTQCAFEPIVVYSSDLEAQTILDSRTVNKYDEELLEALKRLLAEQRLRDPWWMNEYLDLHAICGGAAFGLAPRLPRSLRKGDGAPTLGRHLLLVHGGRCINAIDNGCLAASSASGADCHLQFLRG